MENIEKLIYVIFGGAVTLAIVSAIVSNRSKAPQAIQAFGSALSNVVAAAVNPVTQAYGNGSGQQQTVGPINLAQQIFGSGYGNLATIIPGGSK